MARPSQPGYGPRSMRVQPSTRQPASIMAVTFPDCPDPEAQKRPGPSNTPDTLIMGQLSPVCNCQLSEGSSRSRKTCLLRRTRPLLRHLGVSAIILLLLQAGGAQLVLETGDVEQTRLRVYRGLGTEPPAEGEVEDDNQSWMEEMAESKVIGFVRYRSLIVSFYSSSSSALPSL